MYRLPLKTMNRIILTIGFWVLPLIGWCDSLDYWTIYYNDSAIAHFHSGSQDLVIELDRARIKSGDILTVRYRSDTPGEKGKYELFVRDEKKRKLGITETNEAFGKLSFAVKSLIDFGERNGSKRYDFYYWRQGDTHDNGPMKLVLQVVLKEAE